MINLNDYINKTVEVQLGEDILHVKMPSQKIMSQIAKIEKNIEAEDVEKIQESKPGIAQILINNNTEGKTFEMDTVNRIPLNGLTHVINTVLTMKIEVENDPNSDSQSQAAK